MKTYSKKDIFEIAKKTAHDGISKSRDFTKTKNEFLKDLQSDPDYLKFKKNTNHYDHSWNRWEDKMDSRWDTFRTVNVANEDPYVNNNDDYDDMEQTNEMTGADSSGSFEGPIKTKSVIKRKIGAIPNFTNETVDASASGVYDVPLFGTTSKGRKNPLSIGGPETIKTSRAVKDKKFPKWGGPGGVFIKIKEKCKKFPYCNQGDINAIEVLSETVKELSKKYGISEYEIKELILKEIKHIFI